MLKSLPSPRCLQVVESFVCHRTRLCCGVINLSVEHTRISIILVLAGNLVKCNIARIIKIRLKTRF